VSHAVREARGEVVRIARLLGARGLAVGTSGNVGLRLDDGRIAITPSTMEYDEITVEDVAIVTADGSPSEGRRRPSSELPLHLAVFAARPDVAAIVHTHSPFATALSTARREIPAIHYVLAPLVAPGHDRLRVAPYATFGTEELARNVETALEGRTACLMQNHGHVGYAHDLDAAVESALLVEWACTVYWRARAIGEPAALSEQQMQDVVEQVVRLGYGKTSG
jgi:L-fuculose-phosphate aldolase